MYMRNAFTVCVVVVSCVGIVENCKQKEERNLITKQESEGRSTQGKKLCLKHRPWSKEWRA